MDIFWIGLAIAGIALAVLTAIPFLPLKSNGRNAVDPES